MYDGNVNVDEVRADAGILKVFARNRGLCPDALAGVSSLWSMDVSPLFVGSFFAIGLAKDLQRNETCMSLAVRLINGFVFFFHLYRFVPTPKRKKHAHKIPEGSFVEMMDSFVFFFR